jgi:hypothetical protein
MPSQSRSWPNAESTDCVGDRVNILNRTLPHTSYSSVTETKGDVANFGAHLSKLCRAFWVMNNSWIVCNNTRWLVHIISTLLSAIGSYYTIFHALVILPYLDRIPGWGARGYFFVSKLWIASGCIFVSFWGRKQFDHWEETYENGK